ncbi:hypothetical protein DENSPDRAFT_817768 [Dentipellis sp. KUC8613]|nr:hypothetical protein DENSPDRAFT_817768 [Dentipellis sp. KUC8613]
MAEDMAFPIPSHLPRKGVPQDISSQILSRVSSASAKSLNAELASSWLGELDETILQTKTRIHERVHTDLPAFERQLASSKSFQERLQTLTTNVDGLDVAVTDPETGLIPSLLNALTQHAALAQQALDAEVAAESLEHLLRCRTAFDELEGLVVEGRLPEAVEACHPLEKELCAAPTALSKSKVLEALKHNFRALKDRIEEQLSNAYSRSIVVSSHEIIIRPSVQVRDSFNVVSLSDVLSSLSPASLSNHLTALRRDLTNHYIEHLVAQPTTLTTAPAQDPSGVPQQVLSIFPAPPESEDRTARLTNLASTFDFLAEHLFPALPPHALHFKHSLCKPLTTALLQHFLIPLLPSSLADLPPFLRLAQQAVDVEEKYIVGMLGQDARDREVLHWVEGVATHYERKRRAEILESVRAIVVREEEGERIRVEVEVEADAPKVSTPTQDVVMAEPEPAVVAEQDDSWGFDGEDEKKYEGANGDAEVDEDGWGFDDEPADVDAEPESSPEIVSSQQAEPEPEPQPPQPPSQPEPESAEDAEDPDDAWGWNDGDDETAETPLEDDPAPTNGTSEPPSTASSTDVDDDSSAWDDPWADPDTSAPSDPPASKPAPKPATRLERLAQKSKGKSQHTPQSSIDSPVTVAPPPPTPIRRQHKPEPSRPQKITVPVKPSKVTAVPVQTPLEHTKEKAREKETYAVSACAKDVADAVEAALREGREFAATSVFDALPHASSSSSQPRGSVLLLSAPYIFDLYRALFPVRFRARLEGSVEKSMLFSNDCLYLSGRAKAPVKADAGLGLESVRDKLSETADHLAVWGDSWFEDTVDRECQANAKIIEDAGGFEGTADQERFDECEAAVMRVLGQIRAVSRQLKAVLQKGKYFIALGQIVNATLLQILEEVLALPDITEVESHRLSELCRVLNAVEGLFLDDLNEPSVVVSYVPSWLKFSYLSELLEASLADISYLFDEGALVDFEVQELVKLVQALFADTHQRTNMINKFTAGHPQPR